MGKPVDEFFSDLEALRRTAARVGGLEMQLAESRGREKDLEMRVHQLGGSRDPLVPGLANSPQFAKVEALKELCDQKDAEIRKLNVAASELCAQKDEEIRKLKDSSGELNSALDSAYTRERIDLGRIRTLETALSDQTSKTQKLGDALAIAEKKAATLEAVNLGEEYHKARALDLQKRLDAAESSAMATARVEREFAYAKAHSAYGRVQDSRHRHFAFDELRVLTDVLRSRLDLG